MEQREGRGDRVGRKLPGPIEALYCLVPRTYDERMFATSSAATGGTDCCWASLRGISRTMRKAPDWSTATGWSGYDWTFGRGVLIPRVRKRPGVRRDTLRSKRRLRGRGTSGCTAKPNAFILPTVDALSTRGKAILHRRLLVLAITLSSRFGAADDAGISARQCATRTCSSLEICPPTSDENLRHLACFALTAGKSCIAALEQGRANGRTVGAPITSNDERVIQEWFQANDPQDHSCRTQALQAGWLNASLLLSRRTTAWLGLRRWGLQLLPSFALGIPFASLTKQNDATNTLGSVKFIAGIAARVTPIGYWVSLHGVIGTSDVSNNGVLDKAFYPSPALLMYGVGIDGFGGALGVTFLHADLHRSGLFASDVGSSADFFQVTFDLTSLGLLAAGAARSGD